MFRLKRMWYRLLGRWDAETRAFKVLCYYCAIVLGFWGAVIMVTGAIAVLTTMPWAFDIGPQGILFIVRLG